MDNILVATCSVCKNSTEYKMSEEELVNYYEYSLRGRSMGMIQDIFPKIPAWIRSGAIDQYSNGFCICPKCSGM